MPWSGFAANAPAWAATCCWDCPSPTTSASAPTRGDSSSAPDTSCPGVEVVVQRRPDYLVVEKVGAAGVEAEARDPRR